MLATPKTIWQVPAYLPYLQPPLTKEAVVAAEKAIGYRLPVEYLDLLRQQNGGYIRFSLPDYVHDSIAGIGPYFPSLIGFDWDERQEHVSYPLQGLVPFDGDGHWHLCLDYRRNADSPSITFADIECDCEKSVAASFSEYLAILKPEIPGDYVVEAVANIDGLKALLSQELGFAFNPPDTWAHGYPVENARIGSGENAQRIWISPNTVPRGFVRKEDSRYSTLKDVLPGFGERLPGLPAGSYLLCVTNGLEAHLLDACRQSGLIVRPLREYLDGQ
jgi:hypothetical protein